MRKLPVKIILLYLFLVFSTSVIVQAQTTSPVLKDIEMKGDFPLPRDELITALKLHVGGLLYSDSLDPALKRMLYYMNDKGYIYARIDSAVLVKDRSGSSVRLRIYGQSGEQVRIGIIRIFADSLDSAVYKEQFNLLPGETYSSRLIEEGIREALHTAAENGFPFATADVKDVRLRKEGSETVADVDIEIREGRRVYIKNIVIKGNHYTRSYIILRELDFQPGDVFRQSALSAVQKKLYRLNILKQVKEPTLLAADEDSIIVQIEVVEGNSTNFDGVVGYIPGSNRVSDPEGYFTGLLNLSFNNLFGTARGFYIYWHKLDRLSEEFKLEYHEPWVFHIPLDLGFRLERIVRDTTYIQMTYRLNSSLRIMDDLNFLFSIDQIKSIPDSAASREQRLLRNSVINGELGIEYDTRENLLNPLSGLYFKNTYSFGQKTNYGPSYILEEDEIDKKENIQTLKLWFEWYFNLWSNQVLALHLNGRQIKGNNLQLSDYFWLGGSRSVRGYREKQFFGDIVAWANLEYRFVLSRNSRIFLFNDWGFYRNPVNATGNGEVLMGYGGGVRFDTPLGILGVDYGLGKNDSFSQGKIHFGIINQF